MVDRRSVLIIAIVSSPEGNGEPTLTAFELLDSSSPVVSPFDLSECRILHVEFGTADPERPSFCEAETCTKDESDRSTDINVSIA